MPLLNYTTGIDPDKTASEIARMLSMAGAKAVLTEYETDDNGNQFVSSLSFRMKVGEQDIGFKLPCDWRPVLTLLQNNKKVPRRLCNRYQAVRTAWRIVKDWVEAQLALIETKMVTTQQVFLPYAMGRSGKTLYESIKENPNYLLGDGK